MRNGWPIDEFPKGRTWATPKKEGSYIRKAPFKLLVEAIGDELLPNDVLEEGTFEEPSTELDLQNQVSKVEMKAAYKQYEADGDRGLKDMEEALEEDTEEDTEEYTGEDIEEVSDGRQKIQHKS